MSDTAQSAAIRRYRWPALFLMSFVVFGSYYVYDALSTLQETMEVSLGISPGEYGLVTAMYSFPNTFLLMAVLGGIIVDRFGIRFTGFLFTLLCALGALLTAYGASPTFLDHGPGFDALLAMLPDPATAGDGYRWTPQLVVLMAGRLLFGLGAEAIIVVQNKVIAKWFHGRELAFAFGINLSICRLGTIAALNVSPIFAGDAGWVTAVWLAAGIMIASMLVFLVYLVIDRKSATPVPSSAPEEQFRLADIGALFRNRSFVFITLLCVTFYSAVFPFQSFSTDMLHDKFGMGLQIAALLTSLIVTGSMLFTPLFGLFVDRRGKRASMMVWGSLMLVAVHLVLGLTRVWPVPPMIVLGIAFSMVPAAMWPAVALIVEERRLGTAYGLMASIQNLGLFAFGILAGEVVEWTNPALKAMERMLDVLGLAALRAEYVPYDYTWMMVMFSSLGILGLGFAFLLKHNEAGRHSHGLEQTAKAPAA